MPVTNIVKKTSKKWLQDVKYNPIIDIKHELIQQVWESDKKNICEVESYVQRVC
jgi:hypothetical protein